MDCSSSPRRTGKLIAASASESSDILYGCGFHAADEYFYFEVGSLRAAVVSMLEYQRAKQEVLPDVEVIDVMEICRSFPERERREPFLVLLSRKYDIGKWIVPARFPLVHAEKLQKAGIEVQTADGDFFPERAVKTVREIEQIRDSMKATENAMRQVESFLKESGVNLRGELEWHGKILTCEFIRSEVEAEFKRLGFSAQQTIIACGKDASAPHCIGAGPVMAGQPVVADIFPRSDRTGYWGDMTRTFVKGKASPIVRKAFDAVKLASEEVLKALQPGQTGAVFHKLAADVLIQAGFPTFRNTDGIPCGFIHGLGHGVGLDIHENPRLSPAGTAPLRPGHVVSVEPGLYDPSWGGIRLEDLVVITQSGCENFCSMPKELEIG